MRPVGEFAWLGGDGEGCGDAGVCATVVTDDATECMKLGCIVAAAMYGGVVCLASLLSSNWFPE